MQDRIMYIENKGGETSFRVPSGYALRGTGRIGRVSFSQTGRTVYYGGRQLRVYSGLYKASHVDVESGEVYWISGPKKSGDDCLYPGIVEVDDDVREEYWTTIRAQPENVRLRKYRSEGKYSKRRPR